MNKYQAYTQSLTESFSEDDMTGKPNSWAEVSSTVSADKVAKLPVLFPGQIWPNSNPKPTDAFKVDDVPSKFVTKIMGKSYVVDTQGYNYARYAAKVK